MLRTENTGPSTKRRRARKPTDPNLTPEQRVDVFERVERRDESIDAIATRFGCSRSHIYKVHREELESDQKRITLERNIVVANWDHHVDVEIISGLTGLSVERIHDILSRGSEVLTHYASVIKDQEDQSLCRTKSAQKI